MPDPPDTGPIAPRAGWIRPRRGERWRDRCRMDYWVLDHWVLEYWRFLVAASVLGLIVGAFAEATRRPRRERGRRR